MRFHDENVPNTEKIFFEKIDDFYRRKIIWLLVSPFCGVIHYNNNNNNTHNWKILIN